MESSKSKSTRAVLLSAVSAAAVWAGGSYQVDCGANGVLTAYYSCPDGCPYNCIFDGSQVSCTCTTYQGQTNCSASGGYEYCS
jgi:hypothetical protein